MFDVEHKANSSNKNYNITSEFYQVPSHAYYFDFKIAIRLISFSNTAILSRSDFGVEINLQRTYTNISQRQALFLFLKSCSNGAVFDFEKAVFAIADLLDE